MRSCLVVLCAFAVAGQGRGEERSLGQAIEHGLRRVEKGAASYLTHRECFSCHHQAMSIFTMTSAKKHGFAIESERIPNQVDFTVASFRSRQDQMKEGQGIGGASTTVGYGLEALAAAKYPADETTDAMVKFLILRQKPDGSWASSANRPPTESSSFTTTAVAMQGLKAYARGDNQATAKTALEKGRVWLEENEPKTTEDRVFQLLALTACEGSSKKIEQLAAELTERQRPDGGWNQIDELESDAYATGTVLMALRAAGVAADSPVYHRGVTFLLNTQNEDGSWIVTTRSRPIQTFFDNGDPGGKSQFISFVATNWAVLALLEAWDSATERPAR
jgi:N-acyl-D-amino-acid deacylase